MDLYFSGNSYFEPHDYEKRFVPIYLFSFVVGFAFSMLLDLNKAWINILPTALGWRIVYFVISYLLLSVGIAFSNRYKLPIVPTDIFPRELADITKAGYPKIKIAFADCYFCQSAIKSCNVNPAYKDKIAPANYKAAKSLQFLQLYKKVKSKTQNGTIPY